MTITLKFERAMGYLKINRHTRGFKSPTFVGDVAIAVHERDDTPLVRIPAKAWARTSGDVERLDVQLLGLFGTLVPVPNRLNDQDPDFLGLLGRDRSLLVWARKRVRDNEVCSLSLDLEDLNQDRSMPEVERLQRLSAQLLAPSPHVPVPEFI